MYSIEWSDRRQAFIVKNIWGDVVFVHVDRKIAQDYADVRNAGGTR